MIRILFLIDELGVGGTENQLRLVAEGLDPKVFAPMVGVLDSAPVPELAGGRVPVVPFPSSGPPLLGKALLVRRLARFMDAQGFRIVQTQFEDAAIYGTLAARLCRSRPRIVGTRRNLYHWVEEMPWTFRAYRWTAGFTDAILANSERAAEQCRTMERVPGRRIRVIPNGVEIGPTQGISRREARERCGLPREGRLVGVVGNWRPVKGLLDFLTAGERILREEPGVRLVLAGRGSQRAELEARAARLGIYGRVIFLEGRKDIPDLIRAWDVAVQPSLSESLSNVLLEYMAAGTPVVATSVGDAPRVLAHGKEGLLVEPGRPEHLSGAVLELLRDPEGAEKMARAARKEVEKNYAVPVILHRYEVFYRELAQGGGPEHE